MKTKLGRLNLKELLAKNPDAARIYQENKKKLGESRHPRQPRRYGIGLPYDRGSLAASTDRNEQDA